MISTSTLSSLQTDLSRIQPREVLLSKSVAEINHPVIDIINERKLQSPFLLTFEDPDACTCAASRLQLAQILTQAHPSSLLYATSSDQILKLHKPLHIFAATCLIKYISETFPQVRPAFNAPIEIDAQDTVKIDSNTLASLEVISSMSTKTRKGSLLSIIDKTKTATGSRLLASRLSTYNLT